MAEILKAPARSFSDEGYIKVRDHTFMMLAKDKGRGAVRNSDFLDVWGSGILVLVLDTAAFAFFELI